MAGESSSSSDEDEEHNAALRSVAIDSDAVVQFATPSVSTSARKSPSAKSSTKRASRDDENDEDDDLSGGTGLKFYQIRVQDLLHKHLDKFFEDSPVIESTDGCEVDDPVAEGGTYDGETRLFSKAPRGVTLKRPSASTDFHPKVRRLPPRYDSSDDDSTERESRFRAAAVEGSSIITQAKRAQEKAFAKFLAAEADFQRAVNAEKEQVAQSRQERGELWLPSIANEMMKEIRAETQRRKAMSSEGKIGVVVKYRI